MCQVPRPSPGEILPHEFLAPMGMFARRLYEGIGVSQMCSREILVSKRAGTVDTGLPLDHDAAVGKDLRADILAKIRPVRAAQPQA